MLANSRQINHELATSHCFSQLRSHSLLFFTVRNHPCITALVVVVTIIAHNQFNNSNSLWLSFSQITTNTVIMASVLVKSVLGAGLGAFAESKYSTKIFAAPEGQVVSPLFFATPMVLLGVGFFSLMHGMNVGKARTRYMEQAKKDGEKDVEERYGLPNLYVDGNTKCARAFNAVQRSHQHIFETFPSAILGGLVAAYQFPISAAISTTLYAVGRIVQSLNYAKSEGDVKKRYANPMARYLWYGLIGNFALGFASAMKTLLTVKLAV